MEDIDVASLRPCPFCGESEHLDISRYEPLEVTPSSRVTSWYVFCQTCFARGPYVETPCNNTDIALRWNYRRETTND